MNIENEYSTTPLADRMRPSNIEEIIGHSREISYLGGIIAKRQLFSL